MFPRLCSPAPMQKAAVGCVWKCSRPKTSAGPCQSCARSFLVLLSRGKVCGLFHVLLDSWPEVISPHPNSSCCQGSSDPSPNLFSRYLQLASKYRTEQEIFLLKQRKAEFTSLTSSYILRYKEIRWSLLHSELLIYIYVKEWHIYM